MNFLHMEITLRFLLLSLLLSFCHAQQSPTNIDTQIKGSKWPDYAVDSGAANAYAVTNMPLAPALRAGSVIIFKANNANTGASTLTVNGGSAISIVKEGGLALASGDIAALQVVTVVYDGTVFHLQTGAPAGGNNIKECIVTTGDTDSTSPVLVDGNDSPAQCGDDFGKDAVIVGAACWADSGSPVMEPILTGGTATSIVSSDITCSGGNWVAGAINSAPTVHPFNSDGATCPATPCTIDSNIQTAGGVARYIVMKYDFVTAGGTTAPLGLGTSTSNQVLLNSGGISVAGVSNQTLGTVLTSTGSSSPPTFGGTILSNGTVNHTVSYALLAADRGTLQTFNGTSLTATLPNPPPDATWAITILNTSPTQTLTVSRNSLTINTNTADLVLSPYEHVIIWTDGNNYFADLPIVAGSGVTITRAANQTTIAATGVTATGSPANGNLAKWSGSNSLTNTDLTGDVTTSGSSATTVVKVNGASVPASATALASNSSKQLIAATYQGNGSKVQLSTGSTTMNDCVQFDSNGNTVDAGAACGSGGGGGASYSTLTDASPISWDTMSSFFPNASITLGHATATRAVNLSNLQNGARGILLVSQDGTGGAALTLGTGCTQYVVNNGQGVMTVTQTANAIDKWFFTYDGTNCYWDYAQNYTKHTLGGIRQIMQGSTNGTSVASGASSSSVVSGDTLYIFLGVYAAGAPVAPSCSDTLSSSFTAVADTGNNASLNNSRMYVLRAPVTSTGTDTVTCSGEPNGHNDLGVLDINSNVTTDVTSLGNVNSSAGGNTRSMTTTGTDTLIVAAFTVNTSTDSYSGLTGYTTQITGAGTSGDTFTVYTKASVSSGSQSVTVTGTAAGDPQHAAFVGYQ